MLAARAIAEELMDAEDLAPETYALVMRDLAKVNTLTLARRPTLKFLTRLAAAHPGKNLRILDVGYGDGDMLRKIARWGRDTNLALDLTGIDLNPNSAAVAAAATQPGMTIAWRSGDYAALADEPWDAIISSLVAHHMSHDQLIAFLYFMDNHTRLGWFVNDLHRHGFAWAGFPLLATLMRWHPIVRHDGQLSIARSYRPHEWPPLLAEAGITDAEILRKFPFRLCVSKIR